MDQDFADGGHDGDGPHNHGDVLDIDFDIDGAGTGAHGGERDEGGQPAPPFAEEYDFDLLDDDLGKHDGYSATGANAGIASYGDTHPYPMVDHARQESPQTLPSELPTNLTPDLKAESEIDYDEEEAEDNDKDNDEEEEEELDENGSDSHHTQEDSTNTVRRKDTHGTEEEVDEDEITYDEEEGVGGTTSEQATHDQFTSQSNIADQQVLEEEHDGIAFDFEGIANESIANDLPTTEVDTSGENSEVQESLTAEELAFGPTDGTHPDADEDINDDFGNSPRGNISAYDAGRPEPQAHELYGAVSPTVGTDLPHVTVSYNGSEYDLFAEDDDADPNSYFLLDVAPLDLSLTQFLSSLRNVLSGEITQKEKIFMRIDTLGLEFGETTNRDFLDKKSFRMILSLHERLARNDNSSAIEPLYAHLVTRIDCADRFDELVSGANKGLGLSAFASPVDYSDDEYDSSPTKPVGHSNDGLDVSADDEFSERYQGNDDESPDDEAEDEESHDATMTGAIRLPDRDNGDDVHKDGDQDARIPGYSMNEEGVFEDDLDSHFDRGGSHEQISYDEGSVAGEFRPTDGDGEALKMSQTGLVGSVDETGNESSADARDDSLIQHEGSLEAEGESYEGVEEFVEYSDEDVEAGETNADTQADDHQELDFGSYVAAQPGDETYGDQANIDTDSSLRDHPSRPDGSAIPTQGITQTASGSAGHGTASNPTSATSTLNGDDFHFDSRDFASNGHADQNPNLPSIATTHNEVDEIDWEDHGEDAHFQGIDLTPSSTSGKRSRQDDVPSGLAGEMEAKRRRT